MALELIRDSIRVNQVAGEEITQTIIENDIIVPDSKPDIARILLLDGDVYVNSAEASKDKVVVNGNIAYKILYVSDEQTQSVKSINTNSNFAYTLDVAGIDQGMRCNVKCDAEHFEYNILNGRKINVKAIMSVSGKVMEERELDIVSDLAGVDNLQTMREGIKVKSFIGENDISYTMNESMEVPSGKPTISEILRTDVKITGKDYKITDNKVIAKGEVNITTLYIGDDEDRSIQIMEHEVPFSQFIDLEGLDETSGCDLDYRITGAQFEAAEDGDGELRVLNGDISLAINVSGYKRKEAEIIADAYSPRSKISIEKESFKMDEVPVESRNQIVIKDTLALQEGNPEITQVFNVLCKPVLSDYKVMDDKISLEGILSNNVLYLASDAENPISCYKQEIPFKQVIDVKSVKPDMACDINLDVEHCNYSMVSSTEVELRLVMVANVKAVSQITVPLIVRASDSELEDTRLESQPSITIYFTQPGDSLWKIAKRYLTTVDDIKTVNSLGDREILGVGQQIIIPRRRA